MTHRIIICGIYKSGTSLITKLAGEWGAYIGREDDLFQGDHGCLEHLALQKINDDLLDNNSRVPAPVNTLMEKTKDPSFQSRARQALTAMDNETQEHNALAWAWKDPRLPLTLPFWEPMWEDVIYVIPVRHPVETVLSAAKMEGLSPEDTPLSAGFAYWQYCMLNVLSLTQNSRRKIFIAYDQLTGDPRRECARLCHFLDEQCGRQSADAGQRIEALVSQVEAGRHHYRESRSLAEMELVTREQRALYDFLRVKTIHPHEAFNEDDFALYPGWREYLQALDMLLSLSGTPQT